MATTDVVFEDEPRRSASSRDWLSTVSYGTLMMCWRARDSLLELARQRMIREEKAEKEREVNDLEPETVETFTSPVTGA